MRKGNKTIVIIPAFEEEKYIYDVVISTKKQGDLVLVVDDCSNDETVSIAQEAGAFVISHNENLGNSEALRTGFNFAIKNKFDLLVTLDGDFAHNPDEILDLITQNEISNSAITIGNRFSKETKKIPQTKVYANSFAIYLVNKILNTKYADVACGFRAIKRNFAEEFLAISKSQGFMFVYEMLFFAKEHRYKVDNCPVTVNYDASEIYCTNRKEMVSFIDGISKVSNLNRNLAVSLRKMLEKIKLFEPFTIKFQDDIYCLHPFQEGDGYIFQKQLPVFSNNVLGEVLNV